MPSAGAIAPEEACGVILSGTHTHAQGVECHHMCARQFVVNESGFLCFKDLRSLNETKIEGSAEADDQSRRTSNNGKVMAGRQGTALSVGWKYMDI